MNVFYFTSHFLSSYCNRKFHITHRLVLIGICYMYARIILINTALFFSAKSQETTVALLYTIVVFILHCLISTILIGASSQKFFERFGWWLFFVAVGVTYEFFYHLTLREIKRCAQK
ncbi:hypothetical protein [Candidatus Uabimicrobium amorphum]|uniref:Uncharacterized protein n=1 Tax=Uabimicrobium amorphum TaxID=2596890 RepID=A0A5S9F4B8_UABAM|nr:hypothetical protein [Candidatus Uabimicrobium amorphum]BBM85382.1 hypothetical protein UABAM_03749 [Candidatus Uabimicrobium amorphum]